MISLKVISKRGGGANQVSENEILLKEASVVRVGLSKEQIKGTRRVGNDLVITAVSGEVITVREFFVSFEGNRNDLVLGDDKGGLWLAEFGSGQGDLAAGYSPIDSIEPLLLHQDFNFGVLPWLVGGGLAAAGAAGGGGGGGGGSGVALPIVPLTAPSDTTPPARPTVNPTNAVSITGTAEPGTTVRVTDSAGKEIGSATVAPDGSYVVRPTTPPPNGSELRVVAVDRAGNVSPEARVTVDSVPPRVPTVAPTDGSPITGTAEAGSVVTVTDGRGNVIGSTTAGQNGSYSITPTTPPADGTLIRVVSTDAAGNASQPATTTVDSTAPAGPTVNPTNGSAITGTTEPGALVTVKDGAGNVIGSATAGSNGAYSVTPVTPPVDGASISVVATDPAGNASRPTTIKVDRTAPSAPTVNPTDGSPITGTAEPGSVVTVTDAKGAVIGSTTTAANGVYNFTPAKPPLNGEVIKVVAADAAGNVSAPATATIDGTPPTPTVRPTNGRQIAGTSEPDSVVTISDSKGTVIGSVVTAVNGTYSLTPATPLADGTVIHVVAKDAAGNVGRPATTTVDSRPPDAPDVNPTNGNSVTGAAEAGSVVTVKDGTGKLIGSTTADASGKFGVTPATPLAHGTKLRAAATDAVGNTSAEAEATVDGVPPPAPKVDPTHGSPITGTAEPGSVVTVKDSAGNLIGSATTASNGTYSVTPKAAPANGTVLRVAATDAAGNTGPETSQTVDSVPPARPGIDPTNGKAITGTAEPGSVVTVKGDAGNVIGSATASSNGAYSITPATTPAHGTVLRATATDAAGNTSPEARATVDSAPPATPTVNPTNGNAITGTAEAGSVVTIKDSAGTLIGSTTADANGRFSLNPSTRPAGGTQISVVAADAAGNASPPATTTIDGTPPLAPTFNATSGNPITGTAEPGSVVTVKDDAGNVIGSATAASNGAYSITPTKPPAHGVKISAVATDAAGNASQPGTTTIDGVPPARPAIDPTNGNLITGKAEPGSVVTVKDGAGNIVGSATADAGGAYSIKPATVPAHNTVLRATAADAAGNTSPEARATVDSELPSAPKVDPTNGALIKGTAEPGSVVTVKDGAGKVIGSATADANGAYSIAPATPPAHGAVLDVTVADAAGNTSQPTTATVDGNAPGVPTVSPSSGGTVTGSAEPNSVVTVRDGAGKLIGSTIADASGAYSVTPAAPLPNGTTVSVVATDAAGNASRPGTTTVDSLPPARPTIDATNGNLITGKAEPGSVVTIKDGAGNIVGSATADAGGAYSIKPATVLAHNTVLRATATDAAGNTGPEARSTVDGELPSAPKVDPTRGSLITGSAEAGSVVTVKDDAGKVIGSATAGANGAYSIAPATPPAHGAVLDVTATDAAGNTSQPTSATVDSRAPGAPTVNPTNGSTITGTAEAGSVVTARDNAGKAIGSATAAPNGNYAIDVATPPAHGARIEVVATDAAGNASQPATATVDSVPPPAPTIEPTNGGLISGTAEPGSVVTIRDGAGNLVGSTTAGSGGAYSIKPATVPANDTVLRAVATDAAGNASPEARTTVDGVVPNAPTIHPTNGSRIAGTAEAGSVVTVKDDAGTLVGSATADANGAYSITPAVVPAHGTVLHAVSTDAAGNSSLEATARVDRTALPTPTVNPTDGSPITGTAEAGSVVTIKDSAGKLIGSTTADASGAYSLVPAATPAHNTVLHVVATNAAGTDSPEATARVDSQAPNAPHIDPTNGNRITGTAEAGAVVKVTDDSDKLIGSAIAAPNGSYSIKPAVIPAHGTVLRAVATDPAGNASLEARGTVDRVLPPAPKIEPTAGERVAGTAEANSVVTVRDGAGTLIGSTTADASGVYSIKPATPLPNGTVLRAVSTDAAGNASPEARATVDSAPPNTPTVDPTNGNQITGTAEPGSIVTVKDGASNVIGSAIAGANRAYVVKPVGIPAHGSLLSVDATDAAGNVSQPATARVDGMAPGAPTVNPTNGSSITGTAEPGSVVTVKDGTGKVIGSATAGSGGTYTVNPAKPPEDGATIKVVATDESGNASPEATATVDGLPPGRPMVNPTNGSTIAGTAEPNSVVTVKDGSGNLVGSATAGADGSYSIKPAITPAHGTALSVAATDAAGNTGPAASARVDNVAPAAPVVNPTNGDPITGTAEAGALVTVFDNAGAAIGSATAASDGKYSIKPTATPADGAQLRVVATDPAGNASQPASATVDGKAPDAPRLNPTNGSSITGTAEPGSVVTVKDGSDKLIGSATTAPNGTYVINPAKPPEDGTTIKAVATDAAGNASPATTATVDHVPPARPVVSPTNGNLISGTAEANSVVTIKDDAGRLIGSTTAAPNGTYSLAPATPPANGTVLHATATDAAGNTSPETRVTVDGALPATPTVKPTNGDTVTGTAEPGSVVTVKDKAGNLVGSATADANGVYTVKPATRPAHGTGLDVTAADTAGNTSPPASTVVDSKAPDAPTIAPNHGNPITGTAEPGSTVTVSDGTGKVIGSATAAADGSYSVVPTRTPEDGAKISAVATDAAGNVSPATTATVDAVPPQRPTVSPTNGSLITGTAEAGSVVTVKDDAGQLVGSTTTAPNGTYSLAPATPPAHGTVLHVAATDAAGNTGPETRATVDSAPPAAPTVKPTNGSTITGTAEAASVVTVKDDAGKVIGSATADASGNYTVRPAPVPVHGTVLDVTATDAAGNASRPAAATVDSKAPDAPTVNPTSGSPITGTAEAGSVVTIRDDTNRLIGSTTAGANGTYSFTPGTPPANGTELRVVATDAAGNASPAGKGTVDSVAPVIGVAIVEDANKDGFINAAEKGAGVTVKVTLVSGAAAGDVIDLTDGTNASSITLTAADVANGFVNARFANPAEGAAIQVSATSRDMAGNVSRPVTTDRAVLDTTPPATPAVPTASDDVGPLKGPIANGGITDDGTPTLAGSGAKAGDKIRIYDNGTAIASTTVAADGSWKFDFAATAPLKEGAHRLTVTAVDPVGNESAHSDSVEITVDTTPPPAPAAATSYADDAGLVRNPKNVAASTDDTTPGINIGQIAPDLTPSLYVDGAKVTATYDPATGTLTPTSPLAEGDHKFSYTLSDQAGNESPRSGELRINVDTTPPPALDASVIQVLDDVGAVTGPLAANAQTDDSKPEYVGKADPNKVSSVNVYDKGVLIGNAEVKADGTWRFEPALPLVQGDHSFTARPVDAAGNLGTATPASTFTLLGDVPPAPAITGVNDDKGSLAKDAGTNDTTLTLSGTGQSGTLVIVRANGVEVGSTSVAANGTWSVTTSALSGDGVKNLSAIAKDGAGRSSPETGLYPIVLDTTPPSTPGTVVTEDDQGLAQGPVKAGGTTDDASPTFSGSDVKAGDTVKVYDGNTLIGSFRAATDGAWSVTPDKPLGEGTHSIKYTITDAAGNTSAASAPLDFTVDTSRVIVGIGHAEDNRGDIKRDLVSGARTDDTTPTLVGKATAGAVVTVRDGANGPVLGSTTADAGGNWRFELPAQGEGAHKYEATAVNAAGTTGTAVIELTIDTTAPGVPTIASVGDDVGLVQTPLASDGSTDDTTPTLGGSGATAGDVIKVYDNGGAIGSTTVKADGSWSFTPTTPLTEGPHRLTATAIDAVGNESAQSGSFTVNVDVTAPTTKATLGAISDDTGTSNSDFITSDRTLVATVTVDSAMEPGARVEVSLDNGRTWNTATPIGGRNYQFDNTAASLPDGSHTFLARVVDAAGNATQPTSQVVVVDNSGPTSGNAVDITAYTDDIAPGTGDFGNGTSTNDTTPVLKGTVTGLKAGDVVQVFEGSTLLGTATVTGTAWTFALPALANGGTHTYAAAIADAAGNKGTVSADFSLTVSTAAPPQSVAIVSCTDDQDPWRGTFGSGGATNDTSPLLSGTFGGTLNAGDVVAVYRDGTRLGAAAVTGGSNWSFQDAGLADGNKYSYTARVEDAAGNRGGASAVFELTVDQRAPTAAPSIDSALDDVGPVTGSIAKDGATNDARPELKGAGAEPNGTVNIYDGSTLIGTAAVDATGKWSFVPPVGKELADGPHSLTASSVDAAGNEGPPSTPLVFTVDTVAPPVATLGLGNYSDSFPAAGTLSANQSSDRNGNDNTFDLVLAGADASTASYEVSTDGGQSWKATTAAQNNLSNGKYLFRASLTDAAGNSTAAANSIEVTVDRTAPGLELQRVGGNLVAGTTEAGALVAIDVGNNGTVEASVTADANGNWSWTPSASIAADTVVSAVAYDLAGNASSKSTQLVDTTPPVVTIEKSDGNRFSGTTSDADAPVASPTATRPITVTLSVDRNADGTIDYVLPFTATVTADGRWSIDASTARVNVGAIVTAVAQDYSGNRSTPASVTVGGGTSKISGSASNDNFGYDVQAIGDFNGDGYNDFAVVAPHGSSAARTANAWSVNILYGSKQGLPDMNNVANLPGIDGLKIYTSGDISDSNILTAVQGYGDVNGDGYSDVILYDDNLNSDWVIFGRSSASATSSPVSVDVRTIISSGGNSDGVAIVQREGSTWFGAGGALVDVNGDGYADIVMQDWNQGTGDAGTAIIYGHAGAAGSAEWANYYVGFTGGSSPSSYVSDSRNSSAESSRPHTVIYNDDTNHRPGNVMNIGDINGDGYADFAYSLFEARNPVGDIGNAGAIQVIYGTAKGFPQDYSLQTDYRNVTHGFRVYGEQANQFLGTNIDPEPYGYLSNTGMPTSSGDVNGDGIADLIIGSPQFGPDAGEQRGPGRVYVVYGKAGGASSNVNLANFSSADGFVITASDSTPDAMFGNGTSVGDFNGDGIDDIAIGAPLADVKGMVNNGAVYIVYGRQGGYSGTQSVAASYWGGNSANNVSATYRQNGNVESGSMLGVNVALSDLNGDGQADLALGSPYHGRPWMPATGYLEVVYSNASNFTNLLTAGDDTIAATAGRDRLSGGAGNDVITDVRSGDSAYGGAGNDSIHISEITGVVRVDGGLGIDTLAVDASNLTLDLSQLGLRVQGFENFDLGTGASNTGNVLRLRLSDALNQQSSTGTGNGAGQGHLRVTGDSGDAVQLLQGAGNWSSTGSTSVAGVNYNIYHNSALPAANTLGDVWVQQGVSVVLNASGTSNTSTLSQTVAIASYTDNQDPRQGDFASGSTTNDTTPQLNGTLSGSLGSTEVVAVYRDDTRLGTATMTGATTWTFQDGSLSDGATYHYTARVEDGAGNTGAASAAFALTIDQTPPTARPSIDGAVDDVGPSKGILASGATTDDANPVLTGTLTAALGSGDAVRIYEGSTLLGTATVNGTTWTYDLGNLADGSTHTYRAVVTDAAGGEGPASGNFSLTVDYALTVNRQTTVDTTPLVTGAMPFRLADGQHIEVTIAGKTYSSADGAVVVDSQHNTWYVQVSPAIDVGTHDVQAVVKNAAGVTVANDDTSGELIVSEQPKVTVGSAASDPNQKATAYTLGENGMWRIHSNQTMLDANGTDSGSLGSFNQTYLRSNTDNPAVTGSNPAYGGPNYVQNATFMDFNRDGYMDLFAEDSTYADGQQAFSYDGRGYTAIQVGAPSSLSGDKLTAGSANVFSWYGGVVAFDKTGDGFADLAYGDQTPDDGLSGGGYNTQIVLNVDGSILGMVKDSSYAYTREATNGLPNSSNAGNATFDMELSGVDLNNDGKVDLVYHGSAGTTKIGGPEAEPFGGTYSSDPHRLVVATNRGDGTWENTQIIEKAFQRPDDDPYVGNGLSMTWADFNGDGYMDLFLGRGYGLTPDPQYQSRILFNDGTGKLPMEDFDGNRIGSAPSGMHLLDDSELRRNGNTFEAYRLQGGPSLAVDWNGDGKMDAIELPGFGAAGGMTALGNSGPINLYTNTSSASKTGFDKSNLLGESNTIGHWTGDPLTNNAVTGAVAADIDWDGDRDLLAFTQRGTTKFITNTNTVADGTSLHFRILDAQGINSLYGNTVQLFDSKGRLVGTQMINPQSGNQTNDSSAIVDFYGLDAKETYTLALLRIANGKAADVGGLDTLGGNTIENVNAAWTGLKAGEANHAFVLTTESGTNAANANIANGIVGTGYNDTFFATLGNDKFEGGGGAVTVSGVRAWSNTGGLDVVDYKLAGSTPLTIDLGNAGAQNTGFGTATFRNIEGLAGGSGADTFTDNAADNQFEGRGGNDVFKLTGGGRDTLLYKLLASSDATGGNGADSVNGFTVGTFEATPDADRIDLRELLVGYRADGDGAARYINGVATIDAGENIGQYLSVTVSGGNTTLSIDRDGSGSAYAATPLITLNGVTTDLATLLANHQLVLA